jgi:hypothetical protein
MKRRDHAGVPPGLGGATSDDSCDFPAGVTAGSSGYEPLTPFTTILPALTSPPWWLLPIQAENARRHRRDIADVRGSGRRTATGRQRMAGDGDPTFLLRGGGRDGELTTVLEEVTRLYAVSDAPGLVDVYERTDEVVESADNDGPVGVFDFIGQETAEGLAPELQHMQGENPVPGDS